MEITYFYVHFISVFLRETYLLPKKSNWDMISKI